MVNLRDMDRNIGKPLEQSNLETVKKILKQVRLFGHDSAQVQPYIVKTRMDEPAQ